MFTSETTPVGMPCPARRPLDGSPCSLRDGEAHPEGVHVTYADPARRLGITAVWADPHPFEALPVEDDSAVAGFIVARVRDGALDQWWTSTVYASRDDAVRDRDEARAWETSVEHDGPPTEVYALRPQ